MDIRLSEQEQLIAACEKKETWAMKKLYEQYAPAMLGICVRYVNDKEIAKDIMQEGFIKIFTKIKTYKGSGSFEGWMRRIFVTTALEHIRNAQNLLFHGNEQDNYENIADFEISTVEKLSADEILYCISQLSPNLRVIFNLYAIEGYTHVEIARILNIKESTSRSNYMRARQFLQSKLQNLY